MMEHISLGHHHKEGRQRSSSFTTKILVGKDVLKELEQRRSSPSVVAKLMGIDVLPPAYVAHSRRPQEFKDVFEVSEETSDAIRKERPHHFPKGLPSLKRGAMKLKKLMPTKYPYHDETFHNDVEYRNGLDYLNSLEIDNPLFEKCPNVVNHSPNHQRDKDTARTFRKDPVGLANSSLRDIRNPPRENYRDFDSIVVLEPGLGNSHDQEHTFSMPPLSHVNSNCRRDTKQKQTEITVMHNERVSQHLLDTEDVNLTRIKREKYFTSNTINPLSNGKEPSFGQFNMVYMNSTESSQRCSSGDVSSSQNKKSPSNRSTLKISRKHGEADVSSKTLAEMFALSDSERVKRNLGSHAQIEHNKLDRGKVHSKEGCFIVLPKHAPPLPLNNSLDRSFSCEGSPHNENFPYPSIKYNSGQLHFDSSLDKSRVKQIDSVSQCNLKNASVVKHLALEQQRSSPSHDETVCHSWRLDNSTSDYRNEKVLFTADEDFLQEPADNLPYVFGLQLSRKQKVSTLPFQCRDYKSVTISNHADVAKFRKGLEEFEQPSPVSILEPPTDEDSYCSGYFKYDLQDMPNVEKRRNHCRLQDEPEVYVPSDDDNDSSYQSLEVSLVEEDRDFSYLLDILISSGMIVVDWQLLCNPWHSPDFPIGPHVFNKLERKYSKVPTWSKPERRLLFDHANSVLSDVLASCSDVHPWMNSKRQSSPIWGPEGPVEKVWQMMVRQKEDLAIGHPDDKVLDPNWLEVSDDIGMVGKQISNLLHDDLLEVVILEFLMGSVLS